VPTEQVKNMMKTRAGKEYEPATLQEDVRHLYSSHQFVNVWADLHPAGPRRVKVVVYVKEFCSVVLRVQYTGNNSLSDEDLEQVTKIHKGMPMNPAANRLACRAVAERYHDEGRPYATCALLRGGAPGDREVVFAVTEGPTVKVRGLRFTGNTFVGDAVLKTHIDSSAMVLGLVGGTFHAAAADNDVLQLLKYYRSFGYHDVQVNRELVFTGDGREVTLVFHIREGVRYRVAAFPRVAGVRPPLAAELQTYAKMRPGDFYDEGKINGDTKRIKDYLGYRGHDVNAVAVASFAPERPGFVALTYEVKDKRAR
jgi:outer membrane protein insertion porin family